MLSVYVVCWIFLQTFQIYFCIQANSVDPDQTALEEQSDLGPHCLQKWLLILVLNANCKPWSDAVSCSIWLGTTLFANVPFKGCQAQMG